ncbi:DUF2336 domain-containing protein [Methylobacterium planeticum]|uniref:DUF2336 domain-containing protein n=1 Tax=Methylobacterium planeticum TaxID=2615211 RepID=A0A6N6MGT1_9HYPH|nr:DUF2336 domain-containing protein [Methylobacterium planeticum]KAB1070101.1 DUF2336 domain-containing protein [Methylobacterium planeticum]
MSASVDDAPDLSGLIELSRIEHLDLKPVILRVQTDLFIQAALRDRAAAAAFEALACGLIPTVDDETAAIVARKLSPFPATPESVLVRLAARGGAVRDIVVAQAPRLTPPVIEAARRDGAEIGAALAARGDLSRSTLADLAGRNDAEIDRALAGNWTAPLRGESLTHLVARARRAPDLAQALLARPDLEPNEVVPLYLHAAPERREALAAAVAGTAGLRPCPPAPRDAGAILTGLSAAHDVPGFIGALAGILGLDKGFLGAAPDASTRYDLLTLALRAAGLHEEEAVYVFLTLNETVARSAERVFDLVRLFRTVPRPAARDLLSAILDAPLRERAGAAEAHQPYHAPEAPKVRQAAERAPSRPALPGRVRKASGDKAS